MLSSAKMQRRVALTSLLLSSLAAAADAASAGSAIFIHPDGMGVNTWAAVRLKHAGPDGRLAWDQLPNAAVYVGPMRDRVHASSDGGATTHAWGVRAEVESYGTLGGKPIAAARSGAPLSLMREALAAGKAVGIVNTSNVTEPGTGAFLASVADTDDDEAIAAQIIEARPQVILGGGEQWFLPAGAPGVHGPGARRDGRDLIAEARAAGYVVVRTRAELLALPAEATRVLGLFGAEALFHEGAEEVLALRGRSAFREGAPRFDEMMAVAQRLLQGAPQGFLLVGNEETTDNLGGDNNRRLPFLISWASNGDGAGGLVARGSGPGASLIQGTIDSSDVYRALYLGLFGRTLP